MTCYVIYCNFAVFYLDNIELRGLFKTKRKVSRPKEVENDASAKSIFNLQWPWSFSSWSQTWPLRAIFPWTTCAIWHWNQFMMTRVQTIVFISVVTDRRTDGRTDRERYVSAASLVWWSGDSFNERTRSYIKVMIAYVDRTGHFTTTLAPVN